VGEPFLTWAAADRAVFAAGQSGDPLLAAASAWRLSYMITGRKHPQEALEVAMAAAAAIDHTMRAPSPERLSVYEALHLAAATAAAASFDQAMTQSLLATARGIASHTGETNHLRLSALRTGMSARDPDLYASFQAASLTCSAPLWPGSITTTGTAAPPSPRTSKASAPAPTSS
jgi:hypothetical protein